MSLVFAQTAFADPAALLPLMLKWLEKKETSHVMKFDAPDVADYI